MNKIKEDYYRRKKAAEQFKYYSLAKIIRLETMIKELHHVNNIISEDVEQVMRSLELRSDK